MGAENMQTTSMCIIVVLAAIASAMPRDAGWSADADTPEETEFIEEKAATASAESPIYVKGYICGSSSSSYPTGWYGHTHCGHPRPHAIGGVASAAAECTNSNSCAAFNLDTKDKNIPCFFKRAGSLPAGRGNLSARYIQCKKRVSGFKYQVAAKLHGAFKYLQCTKRVAGLEARLRAANKKIQKMKPIRYTNHHARRRRTSHLPNWRHLRAHVPPPPPTPWKSPKWLPNHVSRHMHYRRL